MQGIRIRIVVSGRSYFVNSFSRVTTIEANYVMLDKTINVIIGLFLAAPVTESLGLFGSGVD